MSCRCHVDAIKKLIGVHHAKIMARHAIITSISKIKNFHLSMIYNVNSIHSMKIHLERPISFQDLLCYFHINANIINKITGNNHEKFTQIE
jgi:hypothetical protein